MLSVDYGSSWCLDSSAQLESPGISWKVWFFLWLRKYSHVIHSPFTHSVAMFSLFGVFTALWQEMRNSVKRNGYDCYLSYFQFSGIDQQSCKQSWEKYKSCKQLRLPKCCKGPISFLHELQILCSLNLAYYLLYRTFICF